MSASPERRAALSRRSVLTIALATAIIALAILALAWGSGRPDRSPPLRIDPLAQAAFAGAGPDRRFLTPQESAEAAWRGLLPPGTRSVLATGGQLAFGAWRWEEAGVPPGRLAIRVDPDRQLVSVFRGPDEIGTAVIVYGVEGKDTPRGKMPILGKTRDYHSRTYDAPMPFSLWLRRDGVAIHGSSVTMGRATNGCIGVPVDFAEKLFTVAKKGDIVEVLGKAPAA